MNGRKLVTATAVALGVAGAVLILAILPAEYGVDPTGIGSWAGLTRLRGAADVGEGDADPSRADDGPGMGVEGSPVNTFFTQWSLQETEAATLDDYTAEGGTTNLTIPLDLFNLTTVTATLTWNDTNTTAGQATAPDLFQIQIIAPDGREGTAVLGRNAPGSPGSVNATFTWQPQPPPYQEVDAGSPSDARRAITTTQPADASGQGGWRVRVTLLEAGDATVNGMPVPGAAGPVADEGNRWHITLRARTYVLGVAEKPGLGERHDTARFTLKPGDTLEYKLAMEEGAILEYRWNTDGPTVYFDFHGDREGEDGFTRHRSATATTDSGSLHAPFTGRHGWYWNNPGDSTATLILETRGAYTVIGRV